MTYSFEAQLAVGEKSEAVLDRYFSRWYKILPVDMAHQKIGVDRIFSHREMLWTVEYKTDHVAHKTGNVFLETVSVDKRGKPGWAFSSTAQLLAYYIPGSRVILWVSMASVKGNFITRWSGNKSVSVDNGSYTTRGVLVPLKEFSTICSVLRIEETP